MGEGTEPDYLKRFGESLRKARKAKGLSQRKLAALCNTDHSDISKIERGETNIGILKIVELATALKIHPILLFDFEVEYNSR